MPVVVSDTVIACAGDRGWIHILGANGSFLRSVRVLADSTARVVGVSRLSSPYTFVATGSDGTVALLPDVRNASLTLRQTTLGHPIAGPAAVGLFSSGGGNVYRIAVTTTDGFIFLLDDNLNVLHRLSRQNLRRDHRSSGSGRSGRRRYPGYSGLFRQYHRRGKYNRCGAGLLSGNHTLC